MYLITYQKRNGDIIYRKRSSIPGNVGDETSMGWLIKNIEYEFKGKYYNFLDYKRISRKYFERQHKLRLITRYIKKYGASVSLMILIPLYLIK